MNNISSVPHWTKVVACLCSMTQIGYLTHEYTFQNSARYITNVVYQKMLAGLQALWMQTLPPLPDMHHFASWIKDGERIALNYWLYNLRQVLHQLHSGYQQQR